MDNRKLHRVMAWVAAAPLLLVFSTGALLQVKTWIPGIEPKPVRGSTTVPTIEFAKLLQAARSVPDAQVKEWTDIRAIDVRIAKGIANVRTSSVYQITVHLGTGLVLQAGPRYTSRLIQVHEGSFFGDWVRYGVFFPAALGALVLGGTGIRLLIRKKRGKKNGAVELSGK